MSRINSIEIKFDQYQMSVTEKHFGLHRRNEERTMGVPWATPIRSKIGPIRSKIGGKTTN